MKTTNMGAGGVDTVGGGACLYERNYVATCSAIAYAHRHASGKAAELLNTLPIKVVRPRPAMHVRSLVMAGR